MDKLRKLQIEEYKILKEFKSICDNNGFAYFLTAGTLLGTIRNNGFIPWDDDIDVVMPKKDYINFSKFCKKNILKNGLVYQSFSTDKNFFPYFAKLRKKGTFVFEKTFENIDMEKGIYIDIFPLDYCPTSDKITSLFFKIITLLTSVIHDKLGSCNECNYNKEYAKCLYYICKVFPICFLNNVRSFMLFIMRLISRKKKLCTIGGAHGFPHETYDIDWFKDHVEMYFEGDKFKIPIQYDKLLKNMYGDSYMYPPDDKVGHFDMDKCILE